jgi:uncharacterized membrane protein
MSTPSKHRLGYIDWMRGLACLLMFQTHCYDSWLSDAARDSEFFRWSQLVGTLPAPLFLFLAGISFALVTDKMRRKGIADAEILRTTAKRGAEIFALAMLFRVQEFALGQPWAPWTDLLRVDILNMMGLSMVAMAGVCFLARNGRAASVLAGSAAALLIALVTPPLWTSWRAFTAQLPWPLETYLNGVHTYAEPQPWLFPIFPWMAIAFAGLAFGFVLFSDWAKTREAKTLMLLGGTGVGLYYLSHALDALPVQLYAVYDYWHTSPNFFLARVGVLLVILFACYAWCRWGAGEWGFSPMMQLGQTSLLVYWVHIQFVYGRFSILPKRSMSVEAASAGLAAIFLLMLLLSIGRARWKGKGAALRSRLRMSTSSNT